MMNLVRKQRNWPVLTAVFVLSAFAGVLVCDCCEAFASESVRIQKMPCHSCCSHDMSIQPSCADAVNRAMSPQITPSSTERPVHGFGLVFLEVPDVSRPQADSGAAGPPVLSGSGFALQPIYLSLHNLRI